MTELFHTPEQLPLILHLDGLVGIKESSLNLSEIRKHLASMANEDFVIFSGNSFSLLRVLDMGGAGTICQIPAFAPRWLSIATKHGKTGKDKKRKCYRPAFWICCLFLIVSVFPQEYRNWGSNVELPSL